MTEHFDMYAPVHKGLRNAMQATLLSLGKVDPGDTMQIRANIIQLRDLLVWLHEHLKIEDDFVHRAIEQRRPGAMLDQVVVDHAAHEGSLEALGEDIDALERALEGSVEQRANSAHLLYLSFARFVGENLVHMTLEELEMNALLRKLFTPSEVYGIYGAIIANEKPEQLGRSVRWVLPALDPATRASMLLGARPSIPPALFEQLLQQVRAGISAEDWTALERALDVARAA